MRKTMRSIPTLRSSCRHPHHRSGNAAAAGSLTVGVGVMTYLGWQRGSPRGPAIYATYLEKITTFVLWLLDQGHRVRILMGDAADQDALADVLSKVATAQAASGAGASGR